MKIKPNVDYSGKPIRIGLKPKDYPAPELKEEARYIYQLFLFERGADEQSNIEPVKPKKGGEYEYVLSKVREEYGKWNNEWDHMKNDYEKFFPNGDPELYFSALCFLMDEKNLKAIHDAETHALAKAPPQPGIDSTIQQSRRKIAETAPHSDLN